MNYRDNMQSRLPSYRERIVQIRLGRGEGGLNLDMAPELLRDLAGRGKRAGTLLRDDFDFDHHRWVRLRVLMHQLEAQLERTETALDSIVDGGLLERQSGGGFPYPIPSGDRLDEIKKTLQALRQFTRQIQQGHEGASSREDAHVFPPLAGGELRPTLRVTPDI